MFIRHIDFTHSFDVFTFESRRETENIRSRAENFRYNLDQLKLLHDNNNWPIIFVDSISLVDSIIQLNVKLIYSIVITDNWIIDCDN